MEACSRAPTGRRLATGTYKQRRPAPYPLPCFPRDGVTEKLRNLSHLDLCTLLAGRNFPDRRCVGKLGDAAGRVRDTTHDQSPLLQAQQSLNRNS